MITAGKPGIIEAWMPRPDSSSSPRSGAQNIFTFDPKTGVKTLLPGLPEGMNRCPSNNGARNYLAARTARARTAITSRSTTSVWGKRARRRPGSSRWTYDQGVRVGSEVPGHAVVRQAHHRGRAAVFGSADRYVRAFDDRDGKVLWESPRRTTSRMPFPSPTWWTASNTSRCPSAIPASRQRPLIRRARLTMRPDRPLSCGCGNCLKEELNTSGEFYVKRKTHPTCFQAA